ASGECAGCHGHDVTGFASTDAEGNDVNVTNDWRATMMANAAKDPFWRAKVSHEVLVNPNHQVALETKCTSCHAPQGHFNAIHNGRYAARSGGARRGGLRGLSSAKSGFYWIVVFGKSEI